MFLETFPLQGAASASYAGFAEMNSDAEILLVDCSRTTMGLTISTLKTKTVPLVSKRTSLKFISYYPQEPWQKNA